MHHFEQKLDTTILSQQCTKNGLKEFGAQKVNSHDIRHMSVV